MLKILSFALLESVMLTTCQVLLKLAVLHMPSFGWTREFWLPLFTNWYLAGSGICFAASSLLWLYMLKSFPFSVSYPMISMSYVFALIAAMLVFHEDVSVTKWLGVACIMMGCFLIAK